MLPHTIVYELTDEMAAQATREAWLATGRRLFSPLAVVLAVITAFLFSRSLARQDSLFWLILFGFSPVLLGAVFLYWLSALWWMPILLQRRLARLTTRRVSIGIGQEELVLETSNERMALKWIELKEIRSVPHFRLLGLKSGAEIAIPKEAFGHELLADIRALAPHARLPAD